MYEGEWAGDKMHGKGTMTSPDGNEYIGFFENDQRHGTSGSGCCSRRST